VQATLATAAVSRRVYRARFYPRLTFLAFCHCRLSCSRIRKRSCRCSSRMWLSSLRQLRALCNTK